jgi:hypothetical protein
MRLSRLLVAAAAAVAALPSAATATPAGLLPQALDVTLRAGRAKTVEYALTVAAQQPRPTDLYLLVDTSASMRPYLDGVRRGLASATRALHGRTVGVGVGEFRTTSAADWSDGLTYRALRRVGAIDTALANALDRLGRDESRLPRALPGRPAHTVALDEAVTGDGYLPYASAGQQAGFRQDRRRVVVVVTAAAFAGDSSQPSRSDAVAALRAAGAEVFGLALDAAALGDLTAVATGTGSVTRTTVDCGSGRRVAAGRPAACVVSPEAIGGALSGMLREPRGSRVTLSVTGGGVRRLAPRAWTVDPDRHSRLHARLTLACAATDAGRTYDVRLTAALDGERIAQGSVALHCVR